MKLISSSKFNLEKSDFMGEADMFWASFDKEQANGDVIISVSVICLNVRSVMYERFVKFTCSWRKVWEKGSILTRYEATMMAEE